MITNGKENTLKLRCLYTADGIINWFNPFENRIEYNAKTMQKPYIMMSSAPVFSCLETQLRQII